MIVSRPEHARKAPMREISRTLDVDGRVVPLAAWLPADRVAGAIVLLGHGGSGHKRTERNVRLATRLVERAGVAVLAIDGPFHGDRAGSDVEPADYHRLVVEQGALTVHEQMRRDWAAALADADRSGWCDGPDVAYLGMSMGTRYGIPVCADLGSRLRSAVLGKFGTTRSEQLPRGLEATELTSVAARRIQAPVLFHVQCDDELFPLAGQLDLFALFPSPQKVLRGRPGGHAVTRPDDETAWLDHLTTYLAAE